MDTIKIADLLVFANHGVFPEENVLGQKFLISADLYTDTRPAGKSDDLIQSIHYGEACQEITAFMRQNTYKLIEAVAENLAEYLLIAIPHLQKVRLEVKKPWAPIGLPLEYVSVEITRGWHAAYIGVGSNMGDKEKWIRDAIAALSAAQGCRVTRVSDLITTAPYGVADQDDFLNGCFEIRTLLTPEELLDLLHQQEQAANRVRTQHWGPRTLDLDILLYDDEIIRTPSLTIPHGDMHNRDFVLGPLSAIAPHAWHPLLQKTAKEMLDQLQ